MKTLFYYKICFTIFIFLFNIFGVFSQIYNGNFEGFNSQYSSPPCDDNIDPTELTTATAPFQTCLSTDNSGNTINSWWVSHGTPETYHPSGDLNIHRLVMWTGKWRYNTQSVDTQVKGEGVFLSCYPGFEAGKYYTLKLLIWNADQHIDHVFIHLINSYELGPGYPWYPTDLTQLFDVHNSGYSIPNIPSNNFQIENLYLGANTAMTLHEYTFTPNSNYDALWIHPYSNVCDPIAVLWIDNVFIEDCIDDITYNNTSNLPTMTRRGNFISTLNSVNVTSSQNVTFIAGNYIDLKPGFTAQNGCSFTARIQECGVFGNCSPGNTKQILNSSLENTKENQYETYYSFYPNPVVDKSYFHYDKNEYAYVFIYSSIGKLVNNYELSPSKNSFCISTSDYDAGLYVYKIIMSDNIIKKGKFIVIK